MVGYLALFSIFVLLFALSFYFGIREWRQPQDSGPLSIDVEYVRVENYFGTSFRAKMHVWLRESRHVESPGVASEPVRRVIEKQNGERILVLAAGEFGGREPVNSLIFCDGNLRFAGGSAIHKEIYVVGCVDTGAGSHLQAIASDARIVIGKNTTVSRWVDAKRDVLICTGATVHSRVSSLEQIEVESGVSVQSLYAPVVFTAPYKPSGLADAEGPARPVPEPAASDQPPDYCGGLSAKRLSRDTWLVSGDLVLKPGTRVEGNLVVRGSLHSGADCVFNGNVNAGEIVLGEANVVWGSMVSLHSISLSENTKVRESVVAETDVALASGVRVGSAGREAVVSAGETLRLGNNVAVFGKLTAGSAVVSS